MAMDTDAVNKYSNLTFDDEGKFMEYLGSLTTKPLDLKLQRLGTSLGFIVPKQLIDHLELELGETYKVIIYKSAYGE